MFNRNPKLLISLFLVATILIVFWQVKDCNFINYDDGPYVLENRNVSSGLSVEGIIWSFTAYQAANWHPLTWISHMADCQLYGLKPAGHHLSNVALHILNTLLLFLLLSRITRALWPSAMVAALFALHPLHVESVAWVAERKDVLSTFFWMTTMWAYVWYVEGPGLRRYLLVLLSYALGLLAKPMLVTLPLVLLLLDWWPLGRLHPMPVPVKKTRRASPPPSPPQIWARLFLEKVPLLALAAFSCGITIQAQKQALISLEKIPFTFRFTNAIFSYVSYLGKTLWPAHLAIFYPYPIADLAWGWVAVACLIVLGGSALAIIEARRRPYLAVGWFWYLGTLVPVIGLVQVGSQAMADRYTYIPLIGLFLLAVWGVWDLTAGLPRPKVVLAVIAGIVLTTCACLTWRQVGYWRNSIRLFEHAINVTDNNSLAYAKLGAAYAKQGQNDKAISLYLKAIDINPNDAAAYNNLGLIYAAHDKIDEAISLYLKAIKINPNFADSYDSLALSYAKQGKIDQAINLLQQAITIKKDYADAYYNLGLVYANQGNLDEAIIWYQKAISINPHMTEAHSNLGIAYSGIGKFDEAIPLFQQAIKFNPNFAEAYNNLGLAYANLGKFNEAIPVFQRAIALKPNLTAPYNNLGMIYVEQGNTAAAIAILQKAISINANNNFTQEMLNKLTGSPPSVK